MASLARVLAGQGRGSAPSPARRPPGAARGGGSSTPLRTPAGSWTPPRIVLERGRKCVIFQLQDDHSRLAVASLVARAETSDAAVRVLRQGGVRAYGVPQRLLTDNGASLNPTRRGRQGRLVDHVRALGVEPITGKPYKPTTHGAGTSASTPALLRWLDKQPLAATVAELPGHRLTPSTASTTPSVPTRACPGALPPPRHGTPPRWPRPPDRRTTTRPPNRPDHPGPRAHAAGTQIRPHRHQAHHHRTQRHHQPRRDRLPRLQLPSGPGGPDHLGRPQDHHHRPPRRGPHPVPVAATGNQVRLPPRPRHTRHPRRPPPQEPPKRHRCPDTPTVTDVLTQNCHRSPETSHPILLSSTRRRMGERYVHVPARPAQDQDARAPRLLAPRGPSWPAPQGGRRWIAAPSRI